MKTNKLKKTYSDEELADSFVFRNELSTKQKEEAAQQLNLARKEAQDQMTDSQKMYARLMQLRFQIEDYLKTETFNESSTSYIERLHKIYLLAF